MKVPFTRIGLVTNAFFILVLATSAVFVSAQKAPEAQPPNIDQCANGSLPAAPVTCTGAAWQNGNLNENNSQWVEGQFVPYRVKVPNMSIGEVFVLNIEWDTTEGTDHSLDYIGTYNATNPATPCSGITCGAQGAPFPIPLDPRVSAAGVTQPAGFFNIWGGTITAVSAYQYSGPADYSGTSKAGLAITFTSNVNGDVVLAWSGHISTRIDWGIDNSAINLSGSPYHMRIVGTGNQDRSMSVAGVVYPAKLTIIKEAFPFTLTGASTQAFPFTSTALFSAPFQLVDNNVVGPDRKTNSTIQLFGAANAITVSEGFTAGWSASDVTCTEQDGGLGLGRATFSGVTIGSTNPFVPAAATVTFQEGGFATCVFQNTQSNPTAAPANVAGRVVNSAGRGISGISMILTDLDSGESVIARTNTFGYFMFEGVDTGVFYSLTASAKRYSFAEPTRYFTLNEDAFDLNFYASN